MANNNDMFGLGIKKKVPVKQPEQSATQVEPTSEVPEPEKEKENAEA